MKAVEAFRQQTLQLKTLEKNSGEFYGCGCNFFYLIVAINFCLFNFVEIPKASV